MADVLELPDIAREVELRQLGQRGLGRAAWLDTELRGAALQEVAVKPGMSSMASRRGERRRMTLRR